MRFWLLLLSVPALAVAQSDLWDDESWGEEAEGARVWSGFVEAGVGTRASDDARVDDRNTLEDLRWRIESAWYPGEATLSLKADVGFDGVEDDRIAELRDLSVSFSVGGSTDVGIGRQVQTWGTGDLVFLNDLFPKDFVSFFSGRDDEYLKAAGNALRVSRFSPLVNVDFVWTPVFEPDTYLSGERYSFFSPVAGGLVAPSPPLAADEPGHSFAGGEFAVRLFRTVEGREYALYGYRGYFKQPRALTPSLQPTFAPMSALGASLRRPAGPGLLNAEIAYYDSRDDRSGENPLVPNDQFRLLAGYEWEASPNFTVGFQYYLEWTLDYPALIGNSPFPQWEPDEFRHLLTNRLTWRAGRDRYTWSLFTFFSPSDGDYYLRPAFTYRHSDRWSFTVGGNMLDGRQTDTFFGQLQDGSNAYLRFRFHY